MSSGIKMPGTIDAGGGFYVDGVPISTAAVLWSQGALTLGAPHVTLEGNVSLTAGPSGSVILSVSSSGTSGGGGGATLSSGTIDADGLITLSSDFSLSSDGGTLSVPGIGILGAEISVINADLTTLFSDIFGIDTSLAAVSSVASSAMQSFSLTQGTVSLADISGLVIAGENITISGTIGGLGTITTGPYPYDMGFSFSDTVYYPSQQMCQFGFQRAVNFSANFAGCGAWLAVAATASTTFSIYKNGTLVGAITFAAGATAGTFSSVGGAAGGFVSGDIFTIVGPATPDATAAGLSVTMVGTR